MSRIVSYPRAMLHATYLTIALWAMACSDANGPSSEGEVSTPAPNQAPQPPNAPAIPNGGKVASPPDTTGSHEASVALSAAVVQTVPPHQSSLSCFQPNTGPAVVYVSVVTFAPQPGVNQSVMVPTGPGFSPVTSTTSYGPEWLYLGADVAWTDGRQWYYNGALYNADHSWIAAPNGDWYNNSTWVWLGGHWQPLPFSQRAHAGQAITYAPRGARIWVRAWYVWEAIGNLPRISAIDPWIEVTCTR